MRQEGNIYNEIDVPLLTIFLDHPIHYWDRADVAIKKNVISCLSEEGAQFIQDKTSLGKKSFQLAHAANPKEKTDWASKDVNLFYCGTLRNTPESQKNEWAHHGSQVQGLLNDILDDHSAHQHVSLMAASCRVLQNHIDCTQIENIFPYYVTIDAYLRDYHRVETLRYFKEIPITIAGEGWQPIIDTFNPKTVSYLGRIHPTEVRQLNERAKIVLNAINTYHGSHERVFSSIADGAIPFTSTSDYLKESFNESEIVQFNWSDDLENLYRNITTHDEEMKQLSDNGHKKFLSAHTWKSRAEKIITEMNL